jgi:hypothetical protein
MSEEWQTLEKEIHMRLEGKTAFRCGTHRHLNPFTALCRLPEGQASSKPGASQRQAQQHPRVEYRIQHQLTGVHDCPSWSQKEAQ